MENKIRRILIVSDNNDLRKTLGFCIDGWGYEVCFDDSLHPEITGMIKVEPDVIIMDFSSGTKSKLEICDMLKSDFSTANVPIIVLVDKESLRKKLLDLRHGVDDYLINPPDPLELRIRIEMALKRSQHSFYANSLTGLPGGIVIEETLKEKIASGKPFVTGHVDIDNFKSFNDKYGYLKGDRVIMQTAYMLGTTIRSMGNKDDFVGHIGGDDFVIITTPEKYNAVCQHFICMFDTIIPVHYYPEDRKRGYIVTKDRMHKLRKLPLMSVTVALVMKNSSRDVKNIIELNERISEVKQYLKTISGSKYLADRRIVEKNDHLQVKVFSNDESIASNYKPLGQILLEKKVITIEELDKALKIHWKRGVLLGEILKDLGYVSEEDLLGALSCQEDSLSTKV